MVKGELAVSQKLFFEKNNAASNSGKIKDLTV